MNARYVLTLLCLHVFVCHGCGREANEMSLANYKYRIVVLLVGR